MANCYSSCDGYDECDSNHDGQAFDHSTRHGRFWYRDDCGNMMTDAWYEQALNLLPSQISDEGHDEVPAGGHKNYYLNGWMEDPPRHALDTDCNHHCSGSRYTETEVDCRCAHWACQYDDYYRVIPEECMLAIQHAYDMDSDRDDFKLEFLDPHPFEPDEPNGAGVEDILIPAAAAAGAYTHPMVGVGAAMAAAWIDNYEFDTSDDCYREEIPNTPNNYRLIWEIPHSATHQDQMPSGPCDTSSVKFALDANNDDDLKGKEQGLYTYYRNVYTYRKYSESSNYCTEDSWGCTTVYEYTWEASPVVFEYFFELY